MREAQPCRGQAWDLDAAGHGGHPTWASRIGVGHEPVQAELREASGTVAPLASSPMRIAMVASECEPFAKTGGLADVVDALSRRSASWATRSTSTCRAIAAWSRRRRPTG